MQRHRPESVMKNAPMLATNSRETYHRYSYGEYGDFWAKETKGSLFKMPSLMEVLEGLVLWLTEQIES